MNRHVFYPKARFVDQLFHLYLNPVQITPSLRFFQTASVHFHSASFWITSGAFQDIFSTCAIQFSSVLTSGIRGFGDSTTQNGCVQSKLKTLYKRFCEKLFFSEKLFLCNKALFLPGADLSNNDWGGGC